MKGIDISNDPEVIKCKTAGNFPSDDFRIHVGSFRCGKIQDGVSIHIGDELGFVLAFSDLENIYLAAKGVREALALTLGDPKEQRRLFGTSVEESVID